MCKDDWVVDVANWDSGSSHFERRIRLLGNVSSDVSSDVSKIGTTLRNLG